MPEANEKIKQVEGLVAHGLSLSEALNTVLGGSTAFADRHGFRQNEVTMCFRAYHQRAYPEIRDAACRELDASREWLDRLIDGQKSDDSATKLAELDDAEHSAECEENRATVRVAANATAEALEAAARANIVEAENQIERAAVLREIARRKKAGK